MFELISFFIMKKIGILKSYHQKIIQVELSCIECEVTIEGSSKELLLLIRSKVEEISSNLKTEEISKISAIQSSRQAYKKCGKDPARYRLSAEALLRRISKGMDLYQINNVVDLLNLVSLTTGFSIGGYDVNKIEGDIQFGVGENNEDYEGLGRGKLNIENLPVFRDELGAFGTPTSDSVRTSVDFKTQRFLMVLIGFMGVEGLQEATNIAVKLLEKYASGKNFELQTIKTKPPIL